MIVRSHINRKKNSAIIVLKSVEHASNISCREPALSIRGSSLVAARKGACFCLGVSFFFFSLVSEKHSATSIKSKFFFRNKSINSMTNCRRKEFQFSNSTNENTELCDKEQTKTVEEIIVPTERTLMSNARLPMSAFSVLISKC